MKRHVLRKKISITFTGLFLGCLFLLGGTGCSPKVKIKGVKLAQGKVETTINTTNTGTVEAQNQAILSFGQMGKIQNIKVGLGDRVLRGQVLATLENTDLQIAAEEAQKEWERSQKLFAERLISNVALNTAKKNYEMSKALLNKTTLVAPFDGVITEFNLQMGEMAGSNLTNSGNKAPLRIVDLKSRVIKGEIDEMDLSKVHVGQKARVKIMAVSTTPMMAAVSKIVPYVSTTKEQDRTVRVELALGTADQNVPVGASADIEIITAEKEQTLILPTRCLLGFKDKRFVYKVVDEKLVKTSVKTGLGNYERTEILEGLNLKDLVVFPSEDVEIKEDMKVIVEEQKWP